MVAVLVKNLQEAHREWIYTAMFNQQNDIAFRLPRWIDEYTQDIELIVSREARMKFVLDAVRRNVDEQTGGPFAAGVFELPAIEFDPVFVAARKLHPQRLIDRSREFE